ncbi:MAG: class I SAM-dependent methyltransferase [Massilia sp.]|nr:class I SAM-dependent methyltransferase [Massilia sp.]
MVELGCALRQRAYSFTTVTPLTHQRVNGRDSAAWAHDLPGIFGWSRPFKSATPGADMLALMHGAGVINSDDSEGQGDGKTLRAAVRASTLDGQLYFHSAYPTTAADAVFFGPDTYRFIRALRTSLAALHKPVRRAADIGCGAGPGALTLALAYPGAQVFGIDINPAALVLTDVNARIAGAANLEAVHSNLLKDVDGQFDLIIANPPYLLDREKRAYRHGGGDLGAGLSIAVVDEAIERLAAGGTLMLYTGVAVVASADCFRMAVEPKLRAAGFQWSYEEIDPDVFGEELAERAYEFADRIAVVWLVATRPGGAA